MTELRDLMTELADDAPPPGDLSATSVYAAGRRRRVLGSVARGAAVVTLVAAVGGTAVGAAHFTSRRGGAGFADGLGNASVLNFAGDGNHTYALLRTCPDDPTSSGEPRAGGAPGASHAPVVKRPVSSSPPAAGATASGDPAGTRTSDTCPSRLLGTDDGGRTWTERDPGYDDADGIDSPVAGVLLSTAAESKEAAHTKISTDGGRTWRQVNDVAGSVAEVPTGGWITAPYTFSLLGGPVTATDPHTGIRKALANQPPFGVTGIGHSARADELVVTGRDAQTNEMVAVSRDRGRTWTAHRLPTANQPVPISGTKVVADGSSMYVSAQVISTDDTITVQVSNDDGATWTLRTVPGAPAALKMSDSSYVTGDGTHILTSRDVNNDASAFYAGRDHGSRYEEIPRPAGLPDGQVGLIRMSRPGEYLAAQPGATTCYRSTDGRTWTQVTLP